jgi:hypothetical protein
MPEWVPTWMRCGWLNSWSARGKSTPLQETDAKQIAAAQYRILAGK